MHQGEMEGKKRKESVHESADENLSQQKEENKRF